MYDLTKWAAKHPGAPAISRTLLTACYCCTHLDLRFHRHSFDLGGAEAITSHCGTVVQLIVHLVSLNRRHCAMRHVQDATAAYTAVAAHGGNQALQQNGGPYLKGSLASISIESSCSMKRVRDDIVETIQGRG